MINAHLVPLQTQIFFNVSVGFRFKVTVLLFSSTYICAASLALVIENITLSLVNGLWKNSDFFLLLNTNADIYTLCLDV